MKSLLCVASVLLVACGSHSGTLTENEPVAAPVADNAKALSNGTKKSAAALYFTAEFAQDPGLGELVPLVYSIEPGYSSGQLDIDLSPSQGLSVEGQTKLSREVVQGQVIRETVWLSASEAGEYQLNIYAVYSDLQGRTEAKAIQETISFGSESAAPALEQENALRLPSEVYMPATQSLPVTPD